MLKMNLIGAGCAMGLIDVVDIENNYPRACVGTVGFKTLAKVGIYQSCALTL
jgi:hypothetical protein